MAHSDETKAVALAMLEATRNNFAETSRQMKVPIETLRYWSKGEHVNADVLKSRDIKKGELSDKLELLAHTLIDGIDADKIGEASMKDTAVALGIVVDKMQLLRGEPTAITNDGLTTDERLAGLAALNESVRTRLAGQTPANDSKDG